MSPCHIELPKEATPASKGDWRNRHSTVVDRAASRGANKATTSEECESIGDCRTVHDGHRTKRVNGAVMMSD